MKIWEFIKIFYVLKILIFRTDFFIWFIYLTLLILKFKSSAFAEELDHLVLIVENLDNLPSEVKEILPKTEDFSVYYVLAGFTTVGLIII